MNRPQLRGHRRPLLLGEILVVLCLLRVYDFARGHAEVRAHSALDHGRAVLQIETWLHIDLERRLNHWTAHHDAVAFLASHWYQFAHVAITLTVLGWLWVRHPDTYRRARTALVVTNVIGLTVFLLLPVAPPRLLPGGGFIDLVANAGFGTNHGPVPADQYGAMPSLHLAWAVWTTVVVRRVVRRERVRRAWLAYPLVTTIAVVLTGNHYLLDAVVGTAVALFALTIRPMPAVARPAPGPAAEAPEPPVGPAEGVVVLPPEPRDEPAPDLAPSCR